MRIFFSYTLLALISLAFMACGGEATEDKAPDQQDSAVLTPSKRVMYLEDKGLASPESIIKHGDVYYIANVGKELLPSEKDGDGFISKMDSEGNALEGHFVSEGLDAPKGMAILNGILYVADVDKVKGFDLASGNAAGEIDFSFSGTSFLNDIVAKSGSEIFVSATDINKVYLVKLPDGTPEEIVTQPTIQKPNGLAYDASKNLLYVSTFAPEASGVIGMVTMKPNLNTFTTLSGDYKGSLDGIGMLGEFIYFTDWNNGSLLLLNSESGQVGRYPVGLPSEQIKGPADAYLDEEKGEFWIPGMQENTVTILSLPF
ncbi:MAG: hypothetical protein AAF587_20860 [Bacteroidota bacterium]